MFYPLEQNILIRTPWRYGERHNILLCVITYHLHILCRSKVLFDTYYHEMFIPISNTRLWQYFNTPLSIPSWHHYILPGDYATYWIKNTRMSCGILPKRLNWEYSYLMLKIQDNPPTLLFSRLPSSACDLPYDTLTWKFWGSFSTLAWMPPSTFELWEVFVFAYNNAEKQGIL